MPPPPNPATSPAANSPGTGLPDESSTRPDRSVCKPPSVLRVKMLSRTAISGPALGSRILCGAAVRASRSPRERRALRIAMTCRSLVNGLSISRSRATICRSRSARSISASPVSLFMPATSSGRVLATTKSAPRCLNASTGAGAPGRTRDSVSRMSLPVRSGFCSEPESANSFSMIFWVSTNHE